MVIIPALMAAWVTYWGYRCVRLTERNLDSLFYSALAVLLVAVSWLIVLA